MEIETNINPKVDELMRLFVQTDWAQHRDPEQVKIMLEKTDMSVCLRVEGVLVGYGRVLNDGSFRGLLDDVVVLEEYRGKGYGDVLVNELLKLAEPLEVLFLHAHPKMHDFYLRFGFGNFQGITMVRRKKPRP